MSEESCDREQDQEFAIVLLKAMEHELRQYPATMLVQLGAQYGYQPFLILTATMLSQRSQDTVTLPVAQTLWARAKTPQQLLAISQQELVELIRPCGMQEERAKNLREVCKILVEQFDDEVPSTLDELLSLPGVGPKTANLVLSEAFGIPAVAVDTHVLRISEHLGFVPANASEEEAQSVLEQIFPVGSWSLINRCFVSWGQHVCTPHTPKCVCNERMQAAIEAFMDLLEDADDEGCDEDDDSSVCGCCCC
ncbi:MAG: endonuclease III [Candidatus Dependentiae bacterium]|nr:endonuclease III [Candidatus Dependentiae bacterium]